MLLSQSHNLLGMIGVVLFAACCLTVFATGPGVRDALLKLTRALPASTTAVTSATAIDTGVTPGQGEQIGDIEYLLTAPAVTTGQLPDAKTFVYDIVQSANSDLSSPTTLLSAVITQTGSTGAAAATYRFRLPSNASRYIGFKVTPSGSGTGDASGATATLEALV